MGKSGLVMSVISLFVLSCFNVVFCYPNGRVVFPDEESSSVTSNNGEITAPDAVKIHSRQR